MCFFIIADLPEQCSEPPEDIYLSECYYGLAARKGRQLVCVVSGNCSCGLFWEGSHDEAKMRAKYVKQGWSATKIKRALSDSAAHGSAGIHSGLAMWLASVANKSGAIRIFAHWDSAELNADVQHPSVPAADVRAWKIPAEGWVTIESSSETETANGNGGGQC